MVSNKVQGIAGNYFEFHLKRNIVNIFKRYLEINEDLKKQHDEMLLKIKKELPEQYHNIINTANYFTDKRVQDYRKQVLDVGNSSLNNLLEIADKFEIDWAGNKKY